MTTATWRDYPTYVQSMDPQCGPVWASLRQCALTASRASYWAQRGTRFEKAPEVEAATICGLTEESFAPAQVAAMSVGIAGEPIVRDWYSHKIGKPAQEVGVSVWKQDPRFRGSLDADVDGTLFAEFKIPQFLYRPLVDHIQAIKRGFVPPPGYHAHIFDTHYDQITTNGIIHNRPFCDFIVVSHTKDVYAERLPISQDHWDKVLYPAGCRFYDTYVTPLMQQHGLIRIDPPTSDASVNGVA